MLHANRVRVGKRSLLTLHVQPETQWRGPRQGFRLFGKFKSRDRGGRPKLATETINLIQRVARDNRLWGAERIRGGLLKLQIKVATATIQKYTPKARPPRALSQAWPVFLKNHAEDVWACDFLPASDLS